MWWQGLDELCCFQTQEQFRTVVWKILDFSDWFLVLSENTSLTPAQSPTTDRNGLRFPNFVTISLNRKHPWSVRCSEASLNILRMLGSGSNICILLRLASVYLSFNSCSDHNTRSHTSFAVLTLPRFNVCSMSLILLKADSKRLFVFLLGNGSMRCPHFDCVTSFVVKLFVQQNPISFFFSSLDFNIFNFFTIRLGQLDSRVSYSLHRLEL